MGIFSRLSDIVNSNLNALLDRAEDPEKMARLMIQEMEDTLVEVRSAAVKAIADKKELKRKLERLEEARQEWSEKAEFALGKGREDLAKGALVAKRRLGDQAEAVRHELELIEQGLARYDEDLGKLKSKLDEAKAKKKALEIRMSSAEKRVKMRKAIHDPRVDDALARYDTLERRINELEAEADVFDLGRKNLEEELSDLEAESGVAEELARMKARVQRNSGA